jgi:hypothetical protein
MKHEEEETVVTDTKPVETVVTDTKPLETVNTADVLFKLYNSIYHVIIW